MDASELFEQAERAQEFGQCECLGPVVFTDLDGTKFYGGVRVHNVSVSVGDAVRVKLEVGDDGDEEEWGFCQVLAIYDDGDEVNGDGVKVEARWYMTPDELDAKRKKTFQALENELIESDSLDDIPAGSILELIRVVNEKGGKVRSSSSSFFVCRYLTTANSSALQYVSQESVLPRGMAMSSYQHAYLGHFPEGGKSASASASASSSSGGATVIGNSDPYSTAIRKLHVSVIPEVLPCRVEERRKIYDILRKSIVDRSSTGTIYISGMPGTGKTATLKATVRSLEKEAERGEIPVFQFVEINCLKLQAPVDAYTYLWREVSGSHLAAKAAKLRLTEYFDQGQHQPVGKAGPGGSRNRKFVICLVDEIDYLVTRDEEVVYNFLNWPKMPGSCLLVAGIANVMDLPERLSPRITSRMGISMERMVFMAYTHQQIKEILEGRLADLELKIFDSSSLELVSRKAAVAAGDLRAALKICQRTIELYRDQQQQQQQGHHAAPPAPAATSSANNSSSSSSSTTVPAAPPGDPARKNMMALVKTAADEYRESPLLATMARGCLLDKAILVSMWKQYKASGQEELSVDLIWDRLHDLLDKARLDERVSLAIPPYGVFGEALERMVDQGVLRRVGGQGAGLANKALLSVRAEMTDVLAALNTAASLATLKAVPGQAAREGLKHPLLDYA